MFFVFSIEKWTSESDLSVVKGNSKGPFYFAKKELKIRLFSLNSVINLLFARLISSELEGEE